MSILSDFKQKVRQVICCTPSNVDQNEGPPLERQISASAQAQQQEEDIAQSTQIVDDMNTTAVIEEEQDEQEEDWDDDEIEPSPYDGQTFVVEADKYDKYKYDESQYNGDEELQKAFEELVENYSPSKQVGPTTDEDASLVWSNRFYERPIWDWNPDQEINIPARVQEAR